MSFPVPVIAALPAHRGPVPFDAPWFTDVQSFTRATSWLHGIAAVGTDVGPFLLLALLGWAWWRAHRGTAAAMAVVLGGSLGVAVSYAVSTGVKFLVAEPRPCRALPDVLTLGPCEYVTDYAFPSNHTVLAAAVAVVLLVNHRRLGVFAVVLTVLIGLSRVYVGAHYPHDVAAAMLLGAVLTMVTIVLTRRRLTAAVEHYRRGRDRCGLRDRHRRDTAARTGP